MTLRHCLLALMLAFALPGAMAQAQEGGSAADFGDTDTDTETETETEGDDGDGDDDDGNDDIDDLAEHLNDGYQIY
ncbi:MAG: hypothetical protein KA187_08985, partial [Arenimonas sp.]|nr:hypothetical protein [Arenimonas sp.]